MSKQQRLKRQQQSSIAYSPEYSSPYSSQSILQARFDHASPRAAQRLAFGAKENGECVPLPVFQDNDTHMIPAMTLADSETGCGQVLSDLSDEQLVKQLQLNVADRQGRSSVGFQSNSHIISFSSQLKQPLQERATQQNSPSKDSFSNGQHSFNVQKGSPRKTRNTFVASTVKSHTWQVQSPQEALAKPSKTRVKGEVRRRASGGFAQEPVQNAPVPHPYPDQHHFIRSEIAESSVTNTVTTVNHRESSPGIVPEEEKYVAFVNTDSSQKFDKLLMASGSSPALNNCYASEDVAVRKFEGNSTIQEQPTEEQLQASATVTMINYQFGQRGNHVVPQRLEQQKEQLSLKQSDQGCGESESLAQIRMINEAMKLNCLPCYSHNQSQEDSDSLKSFSINVENCDAGNSNNYMAAPLVQIEYDFSQRRINQASKSNSSLVSQKQSDKTDQEAPTHLRYFIKASLQQASKETLEEPRRMNQDSTLTQNIEQRSRDSIKGHNLVMNEQQKLTQRAGTCRVAPTKSPMLQSRSSLYGQCQVPCEELYKPILRSGASGHKQKESLTQQQKGIPAKLDFASCSGRAQLNSTTPSKPHFVSPTNPAVSIKSRCDSKASVRRNLESQLVSAGQNSLSPVRCSSPFSSNNKKTMLQKLANQQRKDAPVKPYLAKERIQERKKSPSPAVLTRHDTIATSKSFNFNMGDFTTIESQTNRQHRTVQMQSATAVRRENSNTSRQKSSTVTPNVRSPNTVSPISASNRTPTNLLDLQYQQLTAQNSKVQTPQPQQPQMRASVYQLRRAVDGLRSLDMQMFLEIERIKKPSAPILAIARMSCLFFEALRNQESTMIDQVDGMQSWSQIQDYIRTQLTCQVAELRTLLKQKIVALGRLRSDETPRETEIETSMTKLWEIFFTETKVRVIRRFIQTSRLLKGLVHLIYAFVCLALNLEREFNYDNLLCITEQPQIKPEDIKQILVPSVPNSQHHSQNGSQQFSQGVVTRPRSIEREQSFDIQQVDTDQNQSACSRCSCHVKQSRSFASNAQRSNTSRHSIERREHMATVEPPNTSVQLQTNVFKALETVDVDSRDFNAAKGQPLHIKHQPPERSNSDERGQREFLTVNNYTTVQLLKPNHLFQKKDKIDDLGSVMSIVETYQPELSRNCNELGKRISTNRSASSRAGPQTFYSKQSQNKGERKRYRKSTVSSGSDFVSVVRASAARADQQSTGRSSLTPKAADWAKPTQIARLNPKQVASSTASFASVTHRAQQKSSSSQLKNAESSSRHETRKRSVSPLTPKSTSSKLQKVASSINSVSQKRLPTMATSQQKTSVNKHQRATTLFKSTASAAAKQRTQMVVTARPSLKRDTSAKSIKSSNKVAAVASENTSAKHQARKTKSQAQVKPTSSKCATTPKEQKRDFAEMLKQQKRQVIQRNLGSLRQKSATELAQFAYDERSVQEKRMQEPPCERDLGESFSRLHSIPSFGCDCRQKTEDLAAKRQSAAISEEEVSGARNTRRTTSAHPMAPSFTPEKPCCHSHDESMVAALQTPFANANNNYMSSTNKNQLTAELGKYCHQVNARGEVFLESDSHSSSLDGHRSNDARTNFILQQAQAITENINSCYKQHNMPKIDMSTIQMLKMRRLQYMKQVCEQPEPSAHDGYHLYARSDRHQTLQSCNVVTTMTVETTEEFSEEKRPPVDEMSFTEALSKLKAEVAMLMQQRNQ